jgi:serine/threonine-protein kinase
VSEPPPPPPPPFEPDEPTLVQPATRRVVTEVAPPPPVVRPYPWWLWVVAALCLAAAAVFCVLWLTQRDSGGHEVPALVGLNQTEAQDRATSRGFTLKVVRRAEPGTPAVVSDQAPQPGASLEAGAQMMAVVPSGRRQVAVPSLVGLTYARAEQLMESLGLQLRKATVVSAKPKGMIVSQDPKAGEQEPRGATIAVVVSTGTGRVAVPSVEGSSQADAVKKIVDAGLVPIVVQVPSDQPQGTVVAQNPAPNSKATSGGKVRINVSGGTATTQTETLTETRTVTTTQTTTERTPTTETTTVVTTTP